MSTPDTVADGQHYDRLSRAILSSESVDRVSGAVGAPARVAAGLAVYRNNVRAAYLRVLAETFPAVQRLVGETFFRYLARQYFDAHCPNSRLIARYGDALPSFLESFEPATRLPYLPDVARFELAWLGSYHAPEAVGLIPRRIYDAAGAAPDSACFELHPSMRLVCSAYPVHTIWLHTKRPDPGRLQLRPGGERVLICRPGHKVLTKTISPAMFSCLAAIADGSTFGDALEEMASRYPAASVADVIQEIAASELVTSVRLNSNA